MNPATHGNEDNASAPVLYMALELSNKSWRLAFGDGTKRRQMSVPAADLAKLAEAVAKAKEHFKLTRAGRTPRRAPPGRRRGRSCSKQDRDAVQLALGIDQVDALAGDLPAGVFPAQLVLHRRAPEPLALGAVFHHLQGGCNLAFEPRFLKDRNIAYMVHRARERQACMRAGGAPDTRSSSSVRSSWMIEEMSTGLLWSCSSGTQ